MREARKFFVGPAPPILSAGQAGSGWEALPTARGPWALVGRALGCGDQIGASFLGIETCHRPKTVSRVVGAVGDEWGVRTP